MEKPSIRIIRAFLEGGGSICPFAKRCTTHYVLDIDDFKPFINKFESGQAIVISSAHPGWLTTFDDVKHWARHTFLKAMRHAARVSNPDVTDKEITKEIVVNIAPIVMDDAAKQQPNIVLHNKPVITICMAPVYPATHPRYAPLPILVLTWYEDLSKAGVFPKVREAMTREHGYVYDALDLMLPLPDKG